MKYLLVLCLSGCTVSSDTKEEIAARCHLGLMPVIQEDEDSPYILYVDGAVITIKCTEIAL